MNINSVMWSTFKTVIMACGHGFVYFAVGGFPLFLVNVFFWHLLLTKPPIEILGLIMMAGILATLGAGSIGALTMGLASLAVSLRPHRKFDHERASFGGFWGGLIFGGAALPTLVAFLVFSSKITELRIQVANDFSRLPTPILTWIVGTYALGVFVGALVPGLPLWILHRAGETWGGFQQMMRITPRNHE